MPSPTPRDLTIDDARALLRASAVRRVAPLLRERPEISVGGKLREVMVAGTTAAIHRRAPSATGQGRFTAGGWRRGLRK